MTCSRAERLASRIPRPKPDHQSGSGRLVRIRDELKCFAGRKPNSATEVEMSSSTMSRLKGGVVRRTGLTVGLALAALVAVPAVASASTVSISGSTITFAAASGETNGVTVTVVTTNYRFADGPGPDPTAGAGCSDTGATVDCPLNPSTAVTVNLGDNDDTFTAAGVNQ